MFSPMGKKKILLEQRYIKSTNSKPKDYRHENDLETQDNDINNVNSPKKLTDTQITDAIASMTVLEKSLKDPGILGVVMNKILHATIRYRPERDSATLKAFQSKQIDYERFRSYLYSAFWLGFEEEEFEAFIEYFDPFKNKVINGYDFMIAFIKLGTIRKAQFNEEIRKKQVAFQLQQMESEEKKREEKEKKMELAADFNFTPEIKDKAHQKLQHAAFKFDPNHPSCGSTEAFNVNYLKPAVFKEMLKLTFNLKVDRAELGAILKDFKSDIENDPNIPAAEFLRYFMRIGIDLRDKAAKEQREKQCNMNKQAEEEASKKLRAAENKMNQEINFNFTERDEISAKEKVRITSLKYDRYATGSVSLDGFEVDGLNAAEFRDLVRRVFNLNVTSGELGYLVKKYDLKSDGKVNCKVFLNDFLRLGNEGRYKEHMEQLQRQKALHVKAEKDHIKKIESVLNSESLDISENYTEHDLDSAMQKITNAAIRYDKVRGFTASEMGAVVQYFDTDQSKTVNCQKFLTTFTLLGTSKKSSIKSEELQKQRDLWKKQKEDDDAKCLDLSSKILYQVDFEFSEEEKFTAMQKLTDAAIKYDVSHPAALGLDGFEQKNMSAGEWKELVRRTFNLKLTGKEVGAVFSFFENNSTSINCSEFLRYFLHLGISERAKVKSDQLEKQRKEDREREEEHERKVLALANRVTFEVDNNFSEEDKTSIIEKMNKASEAFDKSHPAAPSLEAFDVAFLTPGLFRENLKRVFNVLASPKEIGYLMTLFDKKKLGKIDSKEFMIKFLAMGKKIRDEKRKTFLEKQRLAIKEAAAEEERKLNESFEKAELKVDYDCNASHLDSAFLKFTDASFRYDKTHPSAPNLDGFMGGPIKPGAFRELVRRSFNINLEHKELGACVKHFPHEKMVNMIDGKSFLIEFMRLGFNAKNKLKMYNITKQKQFEIQIKQESEMKLLQAQQKVELDLNNTKFDLIDQENALRKLTVAAALYDKNSPGCVALDAFDSAYLTPAIFREVAKRTFNIVFDEKELVAMINLYDDGHGRLDCQKFLVSFIKIGAEEREKVKVIQLEKQRKDNYMRKTEHERKMKELEDKVLIDVKYDYTDEERESLFEKLKVQAKKYDKNHPGAMSLDGFEQKQMKPHVFREMIKRTFGVVLTPGELGACMHHFDPKISGTISSKKFLIYFLKLGIVEREQIHKSDLEKLRADAILREREHTEKLAAQWAKMELRMNFDFTEDDKNSAMEKLGEAALKFDPASPGPMGLTAFQAKSLSPAIFREMLRRSFNLKVTDGELAALINAYDTDKSKTVNCHEFMVEFTRIGSERRNARQLAQLNKQRKMDEDAARKQLQKQTASDLKHELQIDMDFDSKDFSNALEKIRILASNYDRSHPAAPSLVGFTGTNMKPKEFKFMLLRTFNLTVTDKELGALISVFGAKKEKKSDQPSIRDKEMPEGVRIDNNEFLKYFNKIQREEQSRKHRERIYQERMLIKKERDAEIALEKKKMSDSLQLLIYNNEDENSFLSKVKQATEDYAIDSALFLDGMQGFKGPALPPDKFRELFLQLFDIKLSFSEVGVLLGIIDPGGNATIDGTRFLNWFYKISRYQEKVLLGEISEPLSIDILRASIPANKHTVNNSLNVNKSESPPRSRNITRSPVPNVKKSDTTKYDISKSWDNEYKSSTKMLTSYTATSSALSIKSNKLAALDQSSEYLDNLPADNSHSFVKSTISKNWILPSIAAPVISEKNSDFSFIQYGNADDDNWSQFEQENAEKTYQHLDLLFNTDLNQDGVLVYKSKNQENSNIIPFTELNLLAQNSFTSSAFKDINSKTDSSISLGTILNNKYERTDKSSSTKFQAIKKSLSLSESNLTNLLIPSHASLSSETRLYTAPNNVVGRRIENKSFEKESQVISLVESASALSVENDNIDNAGEKTYLSSLFLANSKSPYAKSVMIPERYPTSTLQKKHPPLEKLEKLHHQLTQSPIALIQKSQTMKNLKQSQHKSSDNITSKHSKKVQKASSMVDSNILTTINPIILDSGQKLADFHDESFSLAGPRLKATIATPDQQNRDNNNNTAGAFFFPALLMPKISTSLCTSNITDDVNSPDSKNLQIRNITDVGIANGTSYPVMLLSSDDFINE